MDGVVLFVAVVFLILAAYLYIRRDDTEFKKYSDAADNVKINISSLEAQTQKVIESQQNFISNTITALEEFNKRLEAIENKKQDSKEINLHLKEPLSINVVYHEPHKIPDVVPQINGKKSSMLQRAGIRPKDNN